MFGEGGGVDQAGGFANGLRFGDRILPPAATAEAAGVMVEIVGRVQRAVIDRAFPAVDLPELRAKRLLPVIDRGRAQRAAGFAFLVRVVQDKDVVVALFVLASGVFGRHPV